MRELTAVDPLCRDSMGHISHECTQRGLQTHSRASAKSKIIPHHHSRTCLLLCRLIGTICSCKPKLACTQQICIITFFSQAGLVWFYTKHLYNTGMCASLCCYVNDFFQYYSAFCGSERRHSLYVTNHTFARMHISHKMLNPQKASHPVYLSQSR